jgi:hypothetical protein
LVGSQIQQGQAGSTSQPLRDDFPMRDL